MLTTYLLPFVMPRRTEKETFQWDDWPTLSDFSSRVRWAMYMRNKMTQKALAAVTGASQQAISKAARHSDGSTFTAQIAAALSVNAYWLATGKGSPDITLKDVPRGAIDLAIAFTHLPPALQANIGRELLNTALPFVPVNHSRYKAIESLYLSLPDRLPQ